MQSIILCPKCHVQVKRDNLGELLCPNCNARLCPKAHIFDGKVCPYCGWEDPNYHLWQKAQKTRAQSSVPRKPQESFDNKPQYKCPRCHTQVNTPRGVCPNQRGCGYSGPMQRRDIQEPATSATPAPMSKPTDTISRSYKSVPLAPRQPSIPPPRSPILPEIAKAERRELKFPSLKRFKKPVLTSLLVVIILGGLIMGGIYVTRLVSQIAEPGTKPPPRHIATSKTYTLSKNVVPETGGEIRIVSPSSSSGAFEPGSQITLMAIPDDCYTFSYWDGAPGSSETTTTIMDSNKSITAHFQLKNTTPPIISEVKIASYSDISTTITWVTDEPSTSQMDYGQTDAYGQTAQSYGEPTTSHIVQITELEPNKTCYFMVKSTDKCGNEAKYTGKLKTLSDIPVGYEVGKRALDLPSLVYWEDPDPHNSQSPNKGETFSFYSKDFRGKKIMLNFWSTFCGACIGEFPLIREIYEDPKWADWNRNPNLVVFTVCTDGRADRIKLLENKYSDEAGLFTFPILLDSEGVEDKAEKSYHIWQIPETVFIDSDGIIRHIKLGRFNSKEEIEAILKSLD